jgi:prepilin-type N-terminal cleavage/methylation domain-containing protein
MRKQAGFTLIEIAIVLVIIGLLLGGVLKGQELITSARVRNLISQQDGVKAAYFGFLDRFRALPGDYGLASANIACTPTCQNGNANGQIQSIALGGATTLIEEHIAVWEHLSRAGFVNGSYIYAATEGPTSVPTNPYVRYIQVMYDNAYGPNPALVPPPAVRHNIKTGNQIPSDILAEIDRKVDDGSPVGGVFQFSNYDGGAGGTAPTGPTCLSGGTTWMAPSIANCGGASLL